MFSLGSILCEILTGKPAFLGRASGEILRKAARGDLADATARLAACEAEPELAALCARCLAPERDERPRDAGVVSEAIAAYLAGVQSRLRAAELAAVEAEARAEAEAKRFKAERQRRRATLALAASVIALAGLGGLWATIVLLDRQAKRSQLDGLITRAAGALDRAERAEEPASHAAWEEAKLAVARAEDTDGGKSGSAARTRLRDLAERLALNDRLSALVDRLDQARTHRGAMSDYEAADEQYAAAFRELDLDPDVVPPSRFAETFAGRPIASDVAGALSDWAAARILTAGARGNAATQGILAAASAIDPDSWRDELRVLLAVAPTDSAARLRELAADRAVLDQQPAVTLCLLARGLVKAHEPKLAHTVLTSAWRRFPGDFWVNYQLGVSYGTENQRDLQIAHLIAAVAIRPKSAAIHHDFGHALKDHGKQDQAISEWREAIRLKPGEVVYHNELGRLLADRRDTEGALAEYREAARLDAERGIAASAIRDLSRTLKALGRPDETVAIYRRILERAPANTEARLGRVAALTALGKHDEAAAETREAIRFAREDATSHFNIGNALRDLGKFEEAIAEYALAVGINPGESGPWKARGLLLARLGRSREARDDLSRAIELEPGDDFLWYRTATLDLWLGDYDAYRRRCLALLDRFEATTDEGVARRVSKICLLDHRPHDGRARAIRLSERFRPENGPPQIAAWATATQALAAFRAGRPAEAVERARASSGVSMHSSMFSDLVLAMASDREGRHGEAALWLNLAKRSIAAQMPALGGAMLPDNWLDFMHLHLLLSEAKQQVDGAESRRGGPTAAPTPSEEVRLKSELARWYAKLAVTLQEQAKLDQAEDTIREAVRLKADDAALFHRLGLILRERHKLDETVDALREAIRLKPDDALAHCDLGSVLVRLEDYAGGIAMYRKGEALGSKRPGWKFPLAKRIAEAERLQALSARLPAILKGDDRPGDNGERMAFAQICYDRNRYAAAARLWAEAFKVDPKLAADRQGWHRYNAACAVALSGCGKGNDDPRPDDDTKAKLRASALGWLMDNRDVLAKMLDGGPQAANQVATLLRHWLVDPDLDGVRDQAALAKLPEAERTAWRALWADVDTLLKRADEHGR